MPEPQLPKTGMDPPLQNDGTNDALDVVMGGTDTTHQENGEGAEGSELLSKKRKTSEENHNIGAVSSVPDGQSSHTKKTKLHDDGKSSADRSQLPAQIWHHIFTFCPPRTLGNLLSVNKLFNSYLDPASSVEVEKSPSPLEKSAVKALDPNAIWRISRRAFWPKMPGPMKEKTDLDMWRLACSPACQFCGKTDTRQPLPASDPLRHGPGPDGIATIWQFRVRCCGSCLSSKTLTEMSLLLSAASTFLIPALQFVFVTSETCVVPLSAIERGLLPPSSSLTKLFWTSDVEKLREEFASVRELGAPAAEEWQKGLSTRGSDQRADVAKWEKYADSGGVANMLSLLYPGYKPQTAAQEVLVAPAEGHTRATTPEDAAVSKPTEDPDSDTEVSRMTVDKIDKELVTSAPLPFSGKEKTKEEIDAEWDVVQGPVRLKILKYADEAIIGDWDDGEKVTYQNAPAFAADVLLHVRKRFYMEVEKDARDARAAGREPIVDPFGGPFTQKLSLENMKYVFDVKVKPISSKFRSDLFLCPSCDANFKFFGFEGVIQHYAAKHTTILSVGNIVVHWRAEWPEDPPFRPNPRVSKSTGQPLLLQQSLPPRPSNHRGYPAYPYQTGFQQYSSSNAWPPAQQLYPPPPPPSLPPPPPPPLPSYQPFQQGVHAQQFTPDSASFSNGPYNTGPPHPLPPKSLSYVEPAQSAFEPSPYQPQNEPAAYRPFVENDVQSTAPSSVGVHHVTPKTELPSQPPIPVSSRVPNQPPSTLAPATNASAVEKDDVRPVSKVPYVIRSAETMKEVHRIWNDVTRLKNVPGVLRAFTLLYHADKFYQSNFGGQLPLHLFSEGLAEREGLKSMKSIVELPCKACNRKLGCIPGFKDDRALFDFPKLLSHFDRAHVGPPDARSQQPHLPLNWLEDMLLLPQASALSNIADNAKKQGKIARLLCEAVDDFLAKENGSQKVTSTGASGTRNSSQTNKGQQPAHGTKTAFPREPGQQGPAMAKGGPTAHPARQIKGNHKENHGQGQATHAQNQQATHEMATRSQDARPFSKVASNQKGGEQHQKRKATEQPASRPAAVIKKEPLEHAEVSTRDIRMHDAAAPVEEGQTDLLGALEMHLRGAPAQLSPLTKERVSPTHSQARVVYVDEYGRELIPRRDIRGPSHGEDGYNRYTTDERGRAAHRYPVEHAEHYGPATRAPYAQYRDRSPLPARRYADDPGHVVRPWEYDDTSEYGQPYPSSAYLYQRHRPPPPRQEYYDDYADEGGRVVPWSRPVEYDRYEVVRMVDAEGEYYVRRPVRHEISQAAYRGSERYYSPAPVAAGGRPMPRREYGETYHEPGYGAPHDPYANGPRYERGPGPVRTVNERAGAIPATGERRAVQTNPYDYDEYDPHNPTAEPSVKETTSAAASQRSQQQMQYQ